MKIPTSPHNIFEDPSESHLHSTSANTRRVNKQVMERQRRARINNCLHQIKDIILEDMNKDPSQYQKLEKADILEMTVQYLSRSRAGSKGNSVPPSTSTPTAHQLLKSAGPSTSKTAVEPPRRHFQDLTNLPNPALKSQRALYSPSTTSPLCANTSGLSCPVTFSSLVSSVVPVVMPKPLRPIPVHLQPVRRSPAGHVSPDSQSERPEVIWRPW